MTGRLGLQCVKSGSLSLFLLLACGQEASPGGSAAATAGAPSGTSTSGTTGMAGAASVPVAGSGAATAGSGSGAVPAGESMAGASGSTSTVNGAGSGAGGASGAAAAGVSGAGGASTAAAGGVAGASGAEAAGSAGTAGTGGIMGGGSCEITVDSYELSSAIPTVGIVTWSATGALDSAAIQFGPSDVGLTMNAPVDLTEPGYRTLLLGMKGEREYSFQVVASSGGETCMSETLSLTTGAVPGDVPSVQRQVFDEAAIAPGFMVAAAYGSSMAIIIDPDGEVVWWTEGMSGMSRARMDWEGRYMWMLRGNQAGGDGEMRRVSMDGLEVDMNIPVDDPHHDLAPLPGGSVASITHGGQSACSSVVEISPDLSISPIIEDVSTLYTTGGDCHPNSLLYHQADDSFTISDRSVNLYVKFSRAGEVQWQLGGSNPLGPQIQAPSWQVNHGHHLLDNGNFLFFNNNGSGGMGTGGGSPVVEFSIDYTALAATEVFRYVSDTNESSSSLGDVQRLPNGNTLVTYSNDGIIHEVDASGALVQTLNVGRLGYVMHRESLYGPPPK